MTVPLPTTPLLKVESLEAGYGGRTVLRDVTLLASQGEILAIIGPNGCGKSTLLRAIAGLLPPRSGAVLLNGLPVSELTPRERARRIALLPQSHEGGAELTVEEMVLLGRTPYLPPYGAPSNHDRDVARMMLGATSATAFAARSVGELSGGERQRVLLARALAQQPALLLLDEPISNLDVRYQYEILGLVRRLSRHEGLAVVLVLHQINLAAAVADSLLLLSQDGRIRAHGSPGEVMTPEHLEAVYELPLRVAPHPISGRPQAQSVWTFED